MRRVGVVICAVALVAVACAGDRAGSAGAPSGDVPGTAAGQGVVVATSVFPTAWLAQRIAPAARLVHLAPGGHSAHDLTLSPGDRAELVSADVVLFAGDVGFQPQVEEAVADVDGQVVSLAEVAGERLLAFPGGGGVVDPHVWFDPAIMADAAEAVGDAFAAADPGRAAAYRANADAAAGELAEVAAHAEARLGGPCDRDAAIVSHEAYQYLLASHGLEQVGISGAGGHAEATPQRLAELTERIEASGIPAVLAEPLAGRADAEALAREAGVELVDIHPLGSVGGQRGQRGLPTLLREQIDAVADVLGCP